MPINFFCPYLPAEIGVGGGVGGGGGRTLCFVSLCEEDSNYHTPKKLDWNYFYAFETEAMKNWFSVTIHTFWINLNFFRISFVLWILVKNIIKCSEHSY